MTILDVAERAGVHAGTVSRTLSSPNRVAPATRERVEAAVRDLGFVPNRAARGLITGRTGNLAVIVPDITNPYFSSMVRSVQRAAGEADLQVLLIDTGERREEEVRAARTIAHDVDGFIIISPRRLHRQLEAMGGTRAVFVNRPMRGGASLLLRAAPAVADALRHLASLGHSKVAYLDGPKGSWSAGERRDAVRKTSRAIGMEAVVIDVATPTFEAVTELVDEVIQSRSTAVMAFNDQMAFGIMAGLARRGLSVPGDMSVVGCDDVPMAAMVAPALTTIAMPTDAAGAAAVEMFRNGDATSELFGTFVVRGSTSPPEMGRVTTRRATAGGGVVRRPSGAGRE